MARPLRIEYSGAFYHVFQRGIEKKDIFRSDRDKQKFLSYLSSAHTAYSAIFHAFILMNNHFHLILETSHANLSKIMHYLNTCYALYYNAKHKRVGPLYQGRFKAILVQRDEYLHYLSRYIHLNPVRSNIAKLPEEYPWSSYKYFISNCKAPAWLNTNFILSMFDDDTQNAKDLYKQFIINGIGTEENAIMENTYKGFALGNYDFCEFIKDKFIAQKDDYEIPVLKEINATKHPTLEYIKDEMEKHIEKNNKLRRKLAIYFSRKYTQETLNRIADFFGGIKYTGVSQIVRRLDKERGEDSNLDILLKELEGKIMSNVKT